MAELITNNLRFNKNQKYICLDFESENLNILKKNRPWQVSWLIAEGDKVEKFHDYYLKWSDLNVSKGAAIVTNFDEKKVLAEGKEPLLVLNLFEKYFLNPDYRILFFNGLNFDIYIHNIWRKELGLKSNYSFYINRCIDVHALCKAYKMDIGLNTNDDFLFWQQRLLNYRARGVKTNLTQMSKDFDIKVDESKTHSAIYDIMLTFEVFKKILNKFNIQ